MGLLNHAQMRSNLQNKRLLRLPRLLLWPCCNMTSSKRKRLVLAYRPPLRGVSRALWARNPRRVSERVFRGLPPRGPKVSEAVSEESPESQNSLFLRLWRPFRDCFGHFLDPGAGRPRKTLSETPLRGGRYPLRRLDNTIAVAQSVKHTSAQRTSGAQVPSQRVWQGQGPAVISDIDHQIIMAMIHLWSSVNELTAIASPTSSSEELWGRDFNTIKLPCKLVFLGSQHPSPNVKNPMRIRAANLARNYHIT